MNGEKNNRLEQLRNIAAIATVVIVIMATIYAAIGSYVSDKSRVDQNYRLIQLNDNRLDSIQNRMDRRFTQIDIKMNTQNEQTNKTLHQILIKLTALETKLSLTSK